jgi:hypothetical protein
LQFAAITTGAKDVIQKPYIFVTDNVIMNYLLLRESFEQNVGHFIFPSCTIMYQSSQELIKEDDFNPSEEMGSLYFGAAHTKVYLERMCQFYSKFGNDSFESRLEFDANHFLEGVLLVVDKLSMAHTIETRVPFLDNELVDFCLKLPNEFRQNKNILKEAFSEVLTEDILNRPKQGFSSPDWFKGEGNQAKKWSEAAFNQWLVTFKP